MKKETKELLEKIKTSFDKEFTNAEKLSMSINCDGTLALFDIYAKKHPEDPQFDYDDLTQKELDSFLYDIQDQVEELEDSYTDEEFTAITDEYYNSAK